MGHATELGMVGTTFRRAGAGGLAYYSLHAQPGLEHQALHDACNVAESVYMATCNRVEFFFAPLPCTTVAQVRERFFAFFKDQAQGGSKAPFDSARRLHAFAGEGAVERLFVVSAALDSMVPGEAQVLGQVKQAYSQAIANTLAGARLRTAFEAAFAAAKRVRQHTTLGQGRTSMLSLTLAAIDQRLATPSLAPSQVVVAGAGDMAEQCGRALAERGANILFVNRTLAGAQDLAQRFGGLATSLAQYLANPPSTDVLIAATASPVPLFAQPFFTSLAQAHEATLVPPPVVIDLSVPRNVDTGAAQKAGATLYDVDRMQAMAHAHAQSRQDAIAQARSLLDDALDHYRRKETERAMGQCIARVRAYEHRALTQELQSLKASLDPYAIPVMWPHIERFARGLFGQLAHTSTSGLKALAHDHGPQALNAYLRGAGLADPGASTANKDVP